MSNYTMELRKVVNFFGENEVKSWFSDYELEDYLTPDEIQVIVDRNTWSKEKLTNKIIEHYYFHEIGQETPIMFKQRVKIKMKEIMEEYLPLIYSASIEYDPLINVNFTETFNRTIDNTASSNSSTSSNSNSSGLTINNETPQGNINKQQILNGTYATSTTAGENTGTTTSNGTDNSTSNGIESSTKTIKGNSGVSASSQAMIKQYRQNIIAIDKQIIDRLENLFFQLF